MAGALSNNMSAKTVAIVYFFFISESNFNQKYTVVKVQAKGIDRRQGFTDKEPFFIERILIRKQQTRRIIMNTKLFSSRPKTGQAEYNRFLSVRKPDRLK
jgi:hypothetical protein